MSTRNHAISTFILKAVPAVFGFVCCAFLAVNAQAATFPQPVKIDSGAVSGIPAAKDAVTAFLGIPFATPPVGDLRWKPPVAPAKWTNVLKADHYSLSCMQGRGGGPAPARTPAASGAPAAPAAAPPTQPRMQTPFTAEFDPTGGVSEDCLYLNVWTPASKPAAKLPVMVWIYGGAFVVGGTSAPAYNGEGLASKGVVVVSMNYRLGIFGFLASKELDAESKQGVSGNYGLLDQIAALDWVKRNIAAFGGDPSRVTIFGQSAGGGSVQMLSISPLARGLFQRAISESGTSYPWDPAIQGAPMLIKPLAKLEADGKAFLEKQGVDLSLAKLRAMTAPEIQSLPRPPGQGAFYSVNIDGWAIPEGYADTYAHHKQADVPFMVGTNSGEGGAFSLAKISLAEYHQWAEKTFGAMSEEFLKLYPATTDDEALAARKLAGDDMSRVTRVLWAEVYGEGVRTKPYVYYFNHVLPGPNAALFGAFHMSEIPYVMGSLDHTSRPITDEDRAVSDKIETYWTNFAATGNPSGKGKGQIAWTPATPTGNNVMEVGDGDQPIPAATEARTQFFERWYKTHQPM